MSQKEVISFAKGINRKKSRVLLREDETYSCSGWSLEKAGVLVGRDSIALNEAITTDGTANAVHRYGDDHWLSNVQPCEGDQTTFNYIYHREDSGSYAADERVIFANNERPRFVDYEKFLFAVDGESKRAFIGDDVYDWGIENPTFAPTVTTGGAGNPDGDYYCYVTFYVIFPNDKVVETAPSPAGEVTASSDKIEWANIPVCPYSGSGVEIHRRLYRTVSGTSYLVTTIKDNTTTTYSDDETDSTLQANTILGTDYYTTMPDYLVDIELYLQRIFGIKEERLYWTEVYSPFTRLTTSDIVVTKEEEDLVAIIYWGDQLYIASKEKWRRLQGTDPDTWAIKRTFSDVGVVNKHTLKKSIYGLIGLWYDGIYIFDGTLSKNLTEKVLGRDFFLDLDSLSAPYAEYDGQKYHFYYASSGTTLDSHMIIDFAYYPDLIIYHSDFIATAHEFHRDSGNHYYGYDGDEYIAGGTETITASLQSGDKVFGDITKRKLLRYLYYDINTNNQDVTVAFYVDGSLSTTLTLNNSSRTRDRSDPLPNMEGYRFSILVSCANANGVYIYSPWVLEADLTGD